MDMRSVRGLAEANARLDFLPDAAKEQMGVEIGIIGRSILAAQRRDVAVDTSYLRGKLTMQLQIEQMRARIGLIGVRATSKTSKRRRQQGKRVGRDYQNAFYGRIVEFGRRAQTVSVTRSLKRQVTGNGRTSKRRVIYEGRPYRMRVSALAARPFVHKNRSEHDFEPRLAAFWAGLVARGWGG